MSFFRPKAAGLKPETRVLKQGNCGKSVAQPRPPSARKQPVFIRKRGGGPVLSHVPDPGLNHPFRLPKLHPNPDISQPMSPFFGKENLLPERLDIEDICLPYELEEPVRPKYIKKPSDLRVSRGFVRSGNRPPTDLKPGVFSNKHTLKPQVNVSILSEQDTSLDRSGTDFASGNVSFIESGHRMDSRSPSPITTTRTIRMKQLSKQFQLNKSDLVQTVNKVERRTQSHGLAEDAYPSTHMRREMPSVLFVSDLEEIMKVTEGRKAVRGCFRVCN